MRCNAIRIGGMPPPPHTPRTIHERFRYVHEALRRRFRDLTGAIFASWFVFSPNGPTAFAVGFAETAHMPWSLFYRRMHPTGAKTYLGAADR